MKAFGLPKLKILIVICVCAAVIAALAYLLVLPLFTPAPGEIGAAALGNMKLYYALTLFIAGVLGSAIVAVIASGYTYTEKYLQELIDSFRQPVLVLDSDNRYALFNRESEKLLGISRERDIGKNADPRILGALTTGAAKSEAFNIESIIEVDRRHHQVQEIPIPDRPGAATRRRAIFLRDIAPLMRVRDALREINRGMIVLNANTGKISNSAVSLSQGATEQATSLAAITGSMSEFSKKIQGNTETAAKGTQLAAQAREAAERSGNEIANALSAMNDVQDAGIRIARIVKLIDDIAFQTNLLALNAAVEAARAGRQGKGFAVVADEVRNLAGRSAKAAKDTASMVEDVTERIGNASAYISKLEEMLRNIVQDAIRMADSSASASATSAEQAAGILRVNQELGQMNSVTHSTMSEAEQTATAVEVLARQVETLKHRLDELTVEFGTQDEESGTNAQWQGQSINLVDEPEDLPETGRARSHLEYNGPAEPDAEEAASSFNKPSSSYSGLDWDLNTELGDSTSSLGSLLHQDEYNRKYQDAPQPKGKGGFRDKSFSGSLEGNVQSFKTREGDHVVKPNQNILLDDSEFGRY